MTLYTGKGINPDHIIKYVINRSLNYLDPLIPYSRRAEALLFGTAGAETHFGNNLKQEPGSALGIYQMEPQTIEDVLKRINNKWPNISNKISSIGNVKISRSNQAMVDLFFSTVIARCNYWLEPSPIPFTYSGLYDYYIQVWKPGKPVSKNSFISLVSKYYKGGLE